mgnify:CR=1 FL=1
MSLLDKLKKNSTIKETEILNKSKFFAKKDMIQTSVPMMNVALSGSLEGGLTPGLTVFAGPSKHFKSLLGLVLIKAYMSKHPDAVCLFYDSEFGGNTTDLIGYYNYSNVVVELNLNGDIVGNYNLCVTQTPTPTLTLTPTNTPT